MADPVLNYPVTPANITREAIYAAQLAARVAPTRPPLTLAGATVQARRDALAASSSLTPEQRLEIYPQTINAEYLTPMSTLIAAGDQQAMDNYGIWINPQVGDEFLRRADAAASADNVPATITVASVSNNVPADGTTPCAATFTVRNAAGTALPGIVVSFTVASASSNAHLAAANGTTDSLGVAGAAVTNTTAEDATVTATAGAATITATATFVAAS
jgi:hypothetical protein